MPAEKSNESNQLSKNRGLFSTNVLRDVMARLSSGDADFSLYVHRGPSERFVQFIGNSVRVFSEGTGGSSKIESHLLDNGIVPIETLHDVLEDIRKSNRDIREVLVSRGVMEQQELAELVNQLVHDEICGLVFWDGAQHSLHLETVPAGIELGQRSPLVGTFDRQSLCEEVCEWSRHWDNLQPQLLSDRAVLSLTPVGEQTAGDPFSQLHEPCVACREGVTLRELARRQQKPLVTVCEQMGELQREGLIQASPPIDDYNPHDVSAAIELLEASRETALHPSRVCSELADAYLDANLSDQAAKVLVDLADTCLELDRRNEAAEHLKSALSLRPDDAETFSKLFELLAAQESAAEVALAATAHVRLLLENDKTDAAREAARASSNASRGEFTESDVLAGAFEGCANRDTTLDRLLTLATEYRAIREVEKAIETFKLVLLLDPQNGLARADLERISPESLAELPRADPRAAKARDGKSGKKGASARPVPTLAPRGKKVVYGILGVLGLCALTAVGILVPRLLDRDAAAKETSEGDDESIQVDAFPMPDFGDGGRDDDDDTPEKRAAKRKGRPDHDDIWFDYLEQKDSAKADSKKTGSDAWVPFDASGGDAGETADGPSKNVGPERQQLVDSETLLTFGRSRDLVITNPKTGAEKHRVSGSAGTRWSVGRRGEFICRWKAGNRFQIFQLRSRRTAWSEWALPLGVESVAVGKDAIAMRVGDRTNVVHIDGTPVSGGRLPRWSHGFFSSTGELILASPDSADKGGVRTWGVETRSLKVLWSFRAARGELHWR